jgi:hypothetical protein
MHSSEQFSMNCSVVFADSSPPPPAAPAMKLVLDPSTGVPQTEQFVLAVKAWVS